MRDASRATALYALSRVPLGGDIGPPIVLELTASRDGGRRNGGSQGVAPVGGCIAASAMHPGRRRATRSPRRLLGVLVSLPWTVLERTATREGGVGVAVAMARPPWEDV